MFEDTLDLAENKLILLYIFNKIKLPISNIQITQIVLENNFMNYFTLQQYISELTSSSLLTHIEDKDKGKNRLVLTEKGEKVLILFKNRISSDKIDIIDTYLNNKINDIKKEVTVTANYTIENKNNYIVNLVASENDIALIDIKLSVVSNNQARDLCTKWKNDSSELYSKIINLLINN